MSVSGDLLKRYLTHTGLSQKDLAYKWDVSTTYISQVKNGKDKLTEERLIAVAEALGENPAHYLIQMQAEKAKTDKERTTWLKLLKGNAVVALLTAPVVTEIHHFASCIDMFKVFPKHGRVNA